MEIRVLPHDADHKTELFGLIGEICASMVVHKELGNPITSAVGDTWLVAVDGSDLAGMCGLHPLKGGSIKLHGLYTADDAKLAARLRKEAVRQAKALGGTEAVITDFLSLQKVYEKEGWSVVGPRGQKYLAYRKAV